MLELTVIAGLEIKKTHHRNMNDYLVSSESIIAIQENKAL